MTFFKCKLDGFSDLRVLFYFLSGNVGFLCIAPDYPTASAVSKNHLRCTETLPDYKGKNRCQAEAEQGLAREAPLGFIIRSIKTEVN